MRYPPTQLYQSKMNSLKQVIFNALTKCATPDPAVPEIEYATPEDARDAFIKLVMHELFPEESDELSDAFVKLTVTEPAVVDIPMAVDEPAPVEKKKRAPISDATKAAMKAKRDAKKAGKPTEDSNLQKIDGTWRKHLKKSAGDGYSKEQEGALLAYLNGLEKEDYMNKKSEEHVKAFLGLEAAPAVEAVETDLDVVEFNGTDYFVNPVTKRVYKGEGEYDDEVGWTSYTPIGYAGMAAFASMKL